MEQQARPADTTYRIYVSEYNDDCGLDETNIVFPFSMDTTGERFSCADGSSTGTLDSNVSIDSLSTVTTLDTMDMVQGPVSLSNFSGSTDKLWEMEQELEQEQAPKHVKTIKSSSSPDGGFLMAIAQTGSSIGKNIALKLHVKAKNTNKPVTSMGIRKGHGGKPSPLKAAAKFCGSTKHSRRRGVSWTSEKQVAAIKSVQQMYYTEHYLEDDEILCGLMTNGNFSIE